MRRARNSTARHYGTPTAGLEPGDLEGDERAVPTLLKDVLSSDFRREIFLLVVAAREGIARELLSQNDTLPPALFGSRLVQQLCDNLALQEVSARWAIETWAIALNVPNPISPMDQQVISRNRVEIPGGKTGPESTPKQTPRSLSAGANRSVKSFETCAAAIRSGCSTRRFLMSCADSDFSEWEFDAQAGIAEAQWLMGDCYLEGIAGRLDDKMARQWFQTASDSGLTWGTITLGTTHVLGIGGEVDIATGVSLLRNAVKDGEPAANVRLAQYYWHREGKSGKTKAHRLLRDASDAGYSAAMYLLAKFLLWEREAGIAVPQQVLGLIEGAANQGHIPAKVYLAKVLLGEVTQHIVTSDSTKAMRLLHDAASVGNLRALTALERHGISKYRKIVDTSIGAKLVQIPAGRFTMGSRASDMIHEKEYHDESPPHSVLISHEFFLGRTVVTQSQYRQLMEKNPSKHKWSFVDKGQRPVERVTWKEAIEFCNALSIREGLESYYSVDETRVLIVGGNGYRLPTEAEWEYACRANSATNWSWGSDESVAEEFGAMAINVIEASTRIVGTYKSNDLGLCDMHGGVWEWCWDYYSGDFYSESPAIDPVGPANGTMRVARGGSYWEPPMNCRSATRVGYDPGKRDQDLGFRIARSF